MISVKPLSTYTPEMAARVRELLVQLSRSGTDKGEIPKAWFEEIIASGDHVLLLAYDDNNQIVGMASLTLIMGPGIRKNIYLEDFVTDSNLRGQGVGSALWEAMLEWGRERGALRLEFTCGDGREAAQGFYKAHGAELYHTNFFRKELS